MKLFVRAALFSIFLVVLSSCGSSSGTEAQSEPETNTPEQPAATATTEAVADPTAAPDQDPEPEPEPEEVPDVQLVSFDDDFGTSIKPTLINRCAACHNPGGPGSFHWNLESAQDAADTAQFIASVVATGYMAPWPASDLSVPFHDERALSEDEIEAIVTWAAAGGELDVPGDDSLLDPNGVVALSRTDQVLAPPDAYQGSPAKVDDYRCMIYDPQLTEEAFLAGYNFIPEQTSVVHHAIGMMVQAGGMEEALERDAEEPGAGWECYGGSGLRANDDIFLGWAPGQEPSEFPENSGISMQPGDFIVLQIHYHYEVEAPADGSTLEVRWADGDPATIREVSVSEFVAPVEIPCATNETGPLCDRAAAMQDALERFGREGVNNDEFNAICGASPEDFADMTDGLAWSSCDIPVREFGEIIAVLGHMHEIGSSFRMTLNPGTPDELILLDIPVWDFDWQYNYRPLDSIVLKPGDFIRTECAWDRSLRDPNLEPAYILWADGTNDEMCFATVTTLS